MALDIDKLAILANQLDGIDEVADLLNLDEDFIQYAIENNALDFQQTAELKRAISDFELDNELQFEYGLNAQEIQQHAEQLNVVHSRLASNEGIDAFRESVANNELSMDDLETAEIFFSNSYLTPNIQNAVLSWVAVGNNPKEFLEQFELDGERLDGIEDSAFWEWYRDTFYGD